MSKARSEDRPVLYINVIIHDGTELINAKFTKKMENSKLPKPIQKVAAKNAARAANTFVTTSKIAKKVCENMCEKMPEKMKEKGLTVVMEVVFREGPYAVIELQVKHVDTVIVEQNMREENADMTQDDSAPTTSLAGVLLEWTFRLIGRNNQRLLEEDFLPQKVQEKLEKEMMAIMAEKFEEKKLQADVQILREEKQARYFYTKLKEVQAAMKKATKKGPNDANEVSPESP